MGADLPTDQELDRLQWTTVLYDLHETNPDNGLVRDKTDPAAPSSIAAVGMALSTLPVVIEHGVLFRPFAAKLARRGTAQVERHPGDAADLGDLLLEGFDGPDPHGLAAGQ